MSDIKILKQLRDLAELTENVYMLHKLDILGAQIEKELIKAKIEALNELKL